MRYSEIEEKSRYSFYELNDITKKETQETIDYLIELIEDKEKELEGYINDQKRS